MTALSDLRRELSYGARLDIAQRARLAADDTVGGGNALRSAVACSNDAHADVIRTLVPVRGTDGRDRDAFSQNDLAELVDAWSAWYAGQGVAPRDRIGVFLPDSFDYWIHFQAIAQLGAIGVLVNSNAGRDVAIGLCERAGVVGLYADADRLERLGDPHEALPSLRWVVRAEDVPAPPAASLDDSLRFRHHESDPVVILHSSGTTGHPKAVTHTHGSITAGPKFRLTDHREAPNALMMTALPQSHLGCIAYTTYAVLAGTPTVAASDLPGVALSEAIAKHRPTSVMAFGHAYSELAGAAPAPGALDSVDAWVSMGDAVHHAHITALLDRRSPHLPSPKALDRLGTSELGWGALLYTRDRDTPRVDRCGGYPTGAAEVVVLTPDGSLAPTGTVGLLGARGPAITPGYWNDSDTTVRSMLGGYWLTGDMAFTDDEGRFYQVDRVVDVIRTAEGPGYSVLMEEILLAELPEIRECAVVAGRRGSKTVAVAVCETVPGTDSADLRERANTLLTAAGHPPLALLDVADADRPLPVGVTGKVLKRELRARYAALPEGADSTA